MECPQPNVRGNPDGAEVGFTFTVISLILEIYFL